MPESVNGEKSLDEWLEEWPYDLRGAVSEAVNIFAGDLWLKRGGGISTPDQRLEDTRKAIELVRKKFNPQDFLHPTS